MAIAFLMFAGGCGILATAAKQPVLQAFGTEAVGTVRNVSFRTEKFHPMAKWEAIDYVFETRQGKTVEVRLDRPVQEWSGVSFSHLIVDYWDRFPGINAPRGIQRGGSFVVGLGLFFLLCSFHFLLRAAGNPLAAGPYGGLSGYRTGSARVIAACRQK